MVEHEEISRGIAADHSIRDIAAAIARSPSTVSREITCNGGSSRYRAAEADFEAVAQGSAIRRVVSSLRTVACSV